MLLFIGRTDGMSPKSYNASEADPTIGQSGTLSTSLDVKRKGRITVKEWSHSKCIWRPFSGEYVVSPVG